MNREARRRRLIAALRDRPREMDDLLTEHKRDGRRGLDRPDFIWHYLLQAFSTMGNSRGYAGLMLDRSNYDQVTFDVLSALDDDERIERATITLARAKVRMPAGKAAWLNRNVRIVQAMGGPSAAKERALAQPGREAKIAFMKGFAGIGDKYARDIWMDVYHPDFHESIALDARVRSITQLLGYGFSRYQDHERFYLDLAHEARLQGWELDRLLYNFVDHFKLAVEGGA